MSVKERNAVVPENIKRIMAEKGLKCGAVANWAGITVAAFSNMLNGRQIIDANDLVAIADALNVTPNDLFQRG